MKMKTNINEFYDDIILSDFYEETWNMFNDYCSRLTFTHYICGTNYHYIKDANHFKELCIRSLNETNTFKKYNLSCMCKLNDHTRVICVTNINGVIVNGIDKERIILKVSHDNSWITAMNIINFTDMFEKYDFN